MTPFTLEMLLVIRRQKMGEWLAGLEEEGMGVTDVAVGLFQRR